VTLSQQPAVVDVPRAPVRDGTFELPVANSGDPIAPAAIKQLFQPFYRGTVKQRQQGLRLGLKRLST
jgi:C4-dicarboxylate-specific signal transduction histidine kinase